VNQEIWVAAKSGGFHFAYQNQIWLSRRDDSELYAKLIELFAEQAETIQL
jgi:CyaY protein